MTLVGYLIATLLAVAAGYGFLSLLANPGMRVRSALEQLALAYLVGIVYLGVAGLAMGRMGVPVTFWTVAASIALPLGILAWRVFIGGMRLRGSVRISSRGLLRHRWWQWVLIVSIALKLAYVFSMNLTELRRTDDAFKCWLVLAKRVHFDRTAETHEMPGGYPKLNGMVIHWIGASLGQWDEFKANLSYFNYALFFVLLLYANLRLRAGKGPALAGAYLLSAMPLFLNHATLIGYADLPMAVFLTATGLYAYRYACDGRLDDLVLAAFFLLVMPQIKNEGLVPYFPFGVYAIAVAWLWRRGRPSHRAIWLGTGALVVAGILGVVMLNAMFGEAGPPAIGKLIHWGAFRPGNHWAEVRPALFAHFGWGYNNWMLAGTVAALALPFLSIRFWRRPEAVAALFAILLLVAFIYLFCFSIAYQWLVQGTTVNRTYLQMAPSFLFAAVAMLGRWNEPGEASP